MFSEEVKEEIVSGLTDILANKIDSIILYGSTVRGDDKEDSDVDIAIILYNSMDEDEKSRFIHWNAQIDLKYGVVFSIVDIDKEMFDKWRAVHPYYRNIQNEGIVLWKAA